MIKIVMPDSVSYAFKHDDDDDDDYKPFAKTKRTETILNYITDSASIPLESIYVYSVHPVSRFFIAKDNVLYQIEIRQIISRISKYQLDKIIETIRDRIL